MLFYHQLQQERRSQEARRNGEEQVLAQASPLCPEQHALPRLRVEPAQFGQQSGPQIADPPIEAALQTVATFRDEFPVQPSPLQNLDALRKRAYLARFCVNLEVPEEFLRDEQVSTDPS